MDTRPCYLQCRLWHWPLAVDHTPIDTISSVKKEVANVSLNNSVLVDSPASPAHSSGLYCAPPSHNLHPLRPAFSCTGEYSTWLVINKKEIIYYYVNWPPAPKDECDHTTYSRNAHDQASSRACLGIAYMKLQMSIQSPQISEHQALFSPTLVHHIFNTTLSYLSLTGVKWVCYKPQPSPESLPSNEKVQGNQVRLLLVHPNFQQAGASSCSKMKEHGLPQYPYKQDVSTRPQESRCVPPRVRHTDRLVVLYVGWGQWCTNIYCHTATRPF